MHPLWWVLIVAGWGLSGLIGAVIGLHTEPGRDLDIDDPANAGMMVFMAMFFGPVIPAGLILLCLLYWLGVAFKKVTGL